jgi:hypothetical protein
MGKRHGERGQASRGRNSVLARVKCLLLTMFGVLASTCALPALVPLLRNRTRPARLAAHDLVVASTVLSTVYKNVPTEVSPLTRQRRGPADGRAVGCGRARGRPRRRLLRAGRPVEKRRRLTAHSLLPADGDPDVTEIDQDFLSALEFRDTVLFPPLKPEWNAR